MRCRLMALAFNAVVSTTTKRPHKHNYAIADGMEEAVSKRVLVDILIDSETDF